MSTISRALRRLVASEGVDGARPRPSDETTVCPWQRRAGRHEWVFAHGVRLQPAAPS